ncbi:MAG: metalloprotease TldD, partial [Endozoicomonadaceae bacterium]|nr:metalloprotease TldD [Endozoicomonadaceae bacterium]
MSDTFELAKTQLLYPAELEEEHLAEIMHSMLGNNIDVAELYFQSCQSESWLLEDSIVKSGSFSADKGVGVRSVSGDKTGFAYANDIRLPALKNAASASRSIALAGQQNEVQAWKRSHPVTLYNQTNPIGTLAQADKITFLQQADQYTRSLDARIKRVTVSLSGNHETILVTDSKGTLAADIRPLIHFSISVIVEENGRREQGSFGTGCRGDYQFLLNNEHWKSIAEEAVRMAQVSLQSVPAPAGTMPVVLGSGWNGVLLHEAVGHGLEG